MTYHLSTHQAAAIECPSPNRVIIAGPGSGKTVTTIEAIQQDMFRLPGGPDNQRRIIAITFTVRAAQQLREKLEARGITPWHVGTLHSFALRVVSMHNPHGRVALLDEDSAAETILAVAKSLRQSVTASQVQSTMEGRRAMTPQVSTVIKAYRKLLRQGNAADYLTVLQDAAEVIRSGGFERHTPAEGWLLYVDEYQDSAPVDVEIYDALTCAKKWIVGDPDQNIFEWRGSRLMNLIEITKRPGWKLHFLPENFRSKPEVVADAYRLIRQNETRLDYSPIVTRTSGGLVAVRQFEYPEDEIKTIREALDDDGQPGTWGILTRYNAQRIEIDKALRLAGIYTGESEEELPKDYRLGMAWLAVLASPASHIAHRILHHAQSGKASAQKAAEEGKAMIPKTWPDKWANVNELMGFLASRGVGEQFCELVWSASHATNSLDPAQIALAARPETRYRASRVKVMTMHAAKGLEFDNVWLAATDLGSEPKDMEAERRVFYVAMTRAKNHLWISGAKRRSNPYTGQPEKRMPSPFLP